MNYSDIKFEFLKTVFCNKDTQVLSQSLGYSFDQAKRWRNGSKELRWDEFCELCEVLQLPLSQTLKSVFHFNSPNPEDNYQFVSFLRNSLGHLSPTELSNRIGVHKSVLRRYLNAEVYPNIETVMAMMDINTNCLGSFWIGLVGSQQLGTLQNYFGSSRLQQEIEIIWPMACAVEGLLVTEEYKSLPSHESQWFCDKLGIQGNEFSNLWAQLVKNEQVIASGDKFILNYRTINTSGISPQQICRMAEYWCERSRLRFANGQAPINKKGNPNVVAYRVIPMSKPTMMQATDIIVKAYQDILALAEASEGPYEDVRVLMVHHFSVEDFHQPKDDLKQINHNLNLDQSPVTK